MKLCALNLGQTPPFDELSISFCEEDGNPRDLTVLFGTGGVGKTTLVSAIASTRPGHVTAIHAGRGGDPPGFAVCDWLLGMDDEDRPHPLRIATPLVRVDPDEHREAFRRREQALFDKLAREGGYVFVAFSGLRWFSRQPLVIAVPGRTVARYDVRATPALDDATRSDLSRDTKQALAYAEISGALSRVSGLGSGEGSVLLASAMRRAVSGVALIAGCHYEGLDPVTLEPTFRTADGKLTAFDGLPTSVRHLVAFVALPVRALWAAYPGRDPSEVEGVVCIDDLELHQDASLQPNILGALRASLPSVQWIVTTSSPLIADSCEQGEVLALRRLSAEARVELFQGVQARLH